MRVLLFGPLGDLAGWRERELTPAPESLSALLARLQSEDQALGSALRGRGVQTAVDKAIVRGDGPLSPDAEVAFLPPMSGG